MSRKFHPFDHIDSKLERALKHIGDLQSEVDALLASLPYSSVPDDDPEAHADLRRLVRDLVIPPSIAILTGEAIHQIRSSLDHIASALVVVNKGTVTNATQFPIYPYRPSREKESVRYEDHIRGMTPSAKALIDQLQPFNDSDRQNHPLTLLKHLNNYDKHQALLVTAAVTRPRIHFTVGSHRLITDDPADFAIPFGKDVEAHFVAHVVLPEFGTVQNKPVVDAVLTLWAHVTQTIRPKFRVELTDFSF